MSRKVKVARTFEEKVAEIITVGDMVKLLLELDQNLPIVCQEHDYDLGMVYHPYKDIFKPSVEDLHFVHDGYNNDHLYGFEQEQIQKQNIRLKVAII